jgi:hypothetical protein
VSRFESIFTPLMALNVCSISLSRVLIKQWRAWKPSKTHKHIESPTANDASRIIIEACLKHGVTPVELLGEISQITFDY